jgi:signal transduction histidine kinase
VEGAFSWEDGHLAEANEVAHLAMRDAAPDAPERIELDSDASGAVLALPQALAVTALRNLLENALRHSPAKNSVRLEVRHGPDTISFSVCDRGPGLGDDELALAIQRFWRRGSGRGSGLGLSLVAAIAERFGGSFELLQRSDGGLEAKLTLPRKKQLPSD